MSNTLGKMRTQHSISAVCRPNYCQYVGGGEILSNLTDFDMLIRVG